MFVKAHPFSDARGSLDSPRLKFGTLVDFDTLELFRSIEQADMKRNTQSLATATTEAEPSPNPNPKNNNGASTASDGPSLAVILSCLQTMRDGDFSVRLPGSWTGLEGKIADTFNEIVAVNEQMAQELKRVGKAVGKEGRTRERTRFHESRGAWGEIEVSVNTLVEDLLRPTAEVTRAIAAVAQGNLTQTVRLDVDGRPLEGEFLRSANIVNTMIQQLGIFTAEVTRSRSCRNLERSDRFRQPDGEQPDWPGPQYRRSCYGCCQWRPFAQDHSRCSRRDSAVERSHQHHGGSVAVVCI